MILSESYKNRLQELAGLLDEGVGDKLKNLGFTDSVAQRLEQIDEKLAIFFGNIITREFASQREINKNNIKEILPLINQEELIGFIDRNELAINAILQWLKSPLRQGELNLREINTLTQALEKANEFMSSLQATGQITDESGDIVKRYPDNFYWIDLKTYECPEEADAMGHCGRDGGATTLYSLRDKNKEPHVTIAYNENTKNITQVKGKQNKKPVEKYMRYVADFLKEKASKDEVIGFKWSYPVNGPDLSTVEVKEILKPEHFIEYMGPHIKLLKTNYSSGKIISPEDIEFLKQTISPQDFDQLVKQRFVGGASDISNDDLKRVLSPSEYVDALKQKFQRMKEKAFLGTRSNIGVNR